eukprot:410425-Rhodomonas_salina.1
MCGAHLVRPRVERVVGGDPGKAVGEVPQGVRLGLIRRPLRHLTRRGLSSAQVGQRVGAAAERMACQDRTSTRTAG